MPVSFFVRHALKCSYIRYRILPSLYVPSSENITFVSPCLRLSRRWCLTSVDCIDLRINQTLVIKNTFSPELKSSKLFKENNRAISWRERILIGTSVSYDLCSMCSIGGTSSLRSHSTWDPRRHMYEELSHYPPNRRCPPPPPRMGSADGLSHRGW